MPAEFENDAVEIEDDGLHGQHRDSRRRKCGVGRRGVKGCPGGEHGVKSMNLGAGGRH